MICTKFEKWMDQNCIKMYQNDWIECQWITDSNIKYQNFIIIKILFYQNWIDQNKTIYIFLKYIEFIFIKCKWI